MIAFEKRDSTELDFRLIGQSLPNGAKPVGIAYRENGQIRAICWHQFVTVDQIIALAHGEAEKVEGDISWLPDNEDVFGYDN